MKKFLVFLGVVSLATVVLAQPYPFRSHSFLTVPSVTLTNAVTLTNMAYPGAYQSNVVGLVYTNVSGISNYCSSGNTATLLSDVPMWPMNLNYSTNTQIGVRILSGPAVIAATWTFDFVPVYDDDGNVDTTGGEPRHWGFTAATSGANKLTTLYTNVPLNTFLGCKAIRVRSITLAATNGWHHLGSLTFSGYRPQ